MITFSQNVIIKDLKLNYAVANFSDIGDDLIHPIDDGGFSPHLYPRRHLVMSGSFAIDWMVGGTVLGSYNFHEEDGSLENLLIYPFYHQPADAICLTAQSSDSSYICIVPLNEKINKVVDESFELSQDQKFTLQRGRLYISNIDLYLNGRINSALKPFAAVYNDIEIIPTTNCKISSFYTVKNT